MHQKVYYYRTQNLIECLFTIRSPPRFEGKTCSNLILIFSIYTVNSRYLEYSVSRTLPYLEQNFRSL